MILEDLKLKMNNYEIKKITEKEYIEIHELHKSNPEYFSLLQDHEVTLEESINDVNELPPNTNSNQKFYIGFYREGKLEMVMDYIEEFPQEKIVWIGLLMVDGKRRRKGIGRSMMNSFFEILIKNDFTSIQLGVIDANTKAESFWESLGFNEIRRSSIIGDSKCKLNIIVMEKVLLG